MVINILLLSDLSSKVDKVLWQELSLEYLEYYASDLENWEAMKIIVKLTYLTFIIMVFKYRVILKQDQCLARMIIRKSTSTTNTLYKYYAPHT